MSFSYKKDGVEFTTHLPQKLQKAFYSRFGSEILIDVDKTVKPNGKKRVEYRKACLSWGFYINIDHFTLKEIKHLMKRSIKCGENLIYKKTKEYRGRA